MEASLGTASAADAESSPQPRSAMSNAEAQTLTPENGNGISTLAQVRRVIICAGTGWPSPTGAMKVFEQFKKRR